MRVDGILRRPRAEAAASPAGWPPLNISLRSQAKGLGGSAPSGAPINPPAYALTGRRAFRRRRVAGWRQLAEAALRHRRLYALVP